MDFVDGIRAEAEGYPAVFLNTVGDYGIRELRAAVGIPVVGAGQATFQIAAGLADRFGVLTVWPEATRSMYRRLLEDYGYTDRCVGVRHVRSVPAMLTGASSEARDVDICGDHLLGPVVPMGSRLTDLQFTAVPALTCGFVAILRSCPRIVREALRVRCSGVQLRSDRSSEAATGAGSARLFG
jgi:hypothetical protein